MGIFDKFLDNKNMHWRVRQADRNFKRLKWELKRTFSHKNLETVDKFSMIVVGRNDNYGGDFSERLRATIDWNYKHVPGCELIYVEWNRIEDRPSDTEWISKRYPNSKCFIVPNSIHQLHCTNPKLPMMEYFAKNLGIREASNEWIFCINADVFLGPNALARLVKLNRNRVYGTHYVNIKWENDPISEKYFDSEKYELGRFSTNKTLDSVVGNFILTHRDNWTKATGYDERKTDVRDGVDYNGLMQLLHLGLETMVLGDHYHLDHQESRIYGYNDTHGAEAERKKLLDLSNIPYQNNENWGLQNYSKKLIAERVWELQAI